MHWIWVVALTLPASLALAALSHHFVERPILAWGRRDQARPAAVAAVATAMAPAESIVSGTSEPAAAMAAGPAYARGDRRAVRGRRRVRPVWDRAPIYPRESGFGGGLRLVHG